MLIQLSLLPQLTETIELDFSNCTVNELVWNSEHFLTNEMRNFSELVKVPKFQLILSLGDDSGS